MLVGTVRKFLPPTRGIGWTELGSPSEPSAWGPGHAQHREGCWRLDRELCKGRRGLREPSQPRELTAPWGPCGQTPSL